MFHGLDSGFGELHTRLRPGVRHDQPIADQWDVLKEPGEDGVYGSGMVDCRGELRSNQTPQSSTDSDAKLMRRGSGQPAQAVLRRA
jgi:hypothetical protein